MKQVAVICSTGFESGITEQLGNEIGLPLDLWKWYIAEARVRFISNGEFKIRLTSGGWE